VRPPRAFGVPEPLPVLAVPAAGGRKWPGHCSLAFRLEEMIDSRACMDRSGVFHGGQVSTLLARLAREGLLAKQARALFGAFVLA
jgi:hypothetical protein